MAKYYVPFVNINTFIYEPCGLEPNIYPIPGTDLPSDGGNIDFLSQKTENPLDNEFVKVTPVVPGESGDAINLFQNVIGGGYSQYDGGGVTILNTTEIASLRLFKNGNFPQELSTTASFFTALNIKRNGPYGYPTWKQIRNHENSPRAWILGFAREIEGKQGKTKEKRCEIR